MKCLFQEATVTTMTRRESITWVGRVSDTTVTSAHVYLGENSIENSTPGSLTAVGQRRTTTAETWTTVPVRGASTTTTITGRTVEFITVVRILKYTTQYTPCVKCVPTLKKLKYLLC